MPEELFRQQWMGKDARRGFVSWVNTYTARRSLAQVKQLLIIIDLSLRDYVAIPPLGEVLNANPKLYSKT